MNYDLIAAKSMFAVVFLLLLLGILVVVGELLGEWPFLVRLALGPRSLLAD